MAQALIESGPQPIVIAPTGLAEEVAQNVRMILSTPKGSVPLDREFGLDYSVVDRPMPVARALMEVDIVTQVGRYEPRAKVLRVAWLEDTAAAMDGRALPRVIIDIPGVAA
jgi:phage baseplate assembly protein W